MSGEIYTKEFWAATVERAIGTFCQALAGGGLAGGVITTDYIETVKIAVITAFASAIVAVLKCVAVATLSDGNPSLGSSEVISKPGATADPVGGEEVAVVPDPPVIPERAADELAT